MIPKIIHYCWFGYNTKPKLAIKCIKSWEKKCPDYQIIEWNEDNFDISNCPLYVRQAYEEKQWAFVTDYVRLKVVYDYGGIYLDTDVELKKNLDSLLKYDAYFGFENRHHVNTGLGFGAVVSCNILKEMMKDYCNITFIKEDGNYDYVTCPERNTNVLLRHGLIQNGKSQILNGNICILSPIYLTPIDYSTLKKHHSFKIISIHWYAGSWTNEEQRQQHLRWVKKCRIDYYRHLPNRILVEIFGKDKYEFFKKKLKGDRQSAENTLNFQRNRKIIKKNDK